MYLCVKILATEAQVPIWQLIVIRMGLTAFCCFLWLQCSGDPHPFLGPPGVRGLLILRGIAGFFGRNFQIILWMIERMLTNSYSRLGSGLFPTYYVLQYLSLSDATTISFLSPVLVGKFIRRAER